jgi:hypothetical protein
LHVDDEEDVVERDLHSGFRQLPDTICSRWRRVMPND